MAVCSCRHSVQAAAELGIKNIRRVFGVKENRNVSAKQNTQQSFVRERENGEENFSLRGWQWRFCRCVGAGGAVVVLLFASSEKKRRRTV